MPPHKPAPWGGVREAVDWAGHAPQAFFGQRRPEVSHLAPPPDTGPVSEDCLTLNLWTPGLDAGKRPVMVWFHGGGFSYGSANTPRTAGASLARRGDVVVVTVNHRLNILGFLDLTALGGEEFAHSANAGMLDLVAALEWVRDNIAKVGGDPGNVTIFGQSGGGGKVSALLAMPAAKGLFQRAIVMSGAGIRMVEHDRATKLAEAVLGEVGLKANQLDKLQAVPFERLIAAIEPAPKKLAPHAIDVAFVFDTVNVGGITGRSPAAAVIAAVESSTWASFARAGTPDNKAIPHWPAYTAPDRATMMIDTEWRVQNDPQHEARLLWTKIAVA
jgi:para-nitrobenzyl esterase